MKYKILFFGTSEFAIPPLRALLSDDRFEVVGLVTQPDRPVGRHAVMTPPPIKEIASDIPVYQPEKISDEEFKSMLMHKDSICDAFVVVSYGKILPKWLIDLPKHGVLNVHGSLLPRWRGAAPIQAAIAAGDTTSGVTVMLIDEQLDHGAILAQAEEPIFADDIGSTLHDRLAELGGKLLPDVLADFLAGKITPVEQEHDKATFCKTLKREDGKLDFTKTAEELERQIRAYNPWPGTWMEIEGKRVKVHAAQVGAIMGMPMFSCANGTQLTLTRVQPEGKKEMSGEDFLRGQH
jgi:methionyl-tRNA formyltransferase